MKQLFIIIFLFFTAASGPLFEFELTINPEILFSEVNLTHGFGDQASLLIDPTHQLIIKNRFNDTLYQQQYVFRDYISLHCQDTNCTDRVRFINESTRLIKIPYHATADYILIKEIDGNRSVEVSVKHLSRYCGNGMCNQGQSTATCPIDCPQQESTTQEQTTNQTYLLGLAVLALIIAFITIIVAHTRKHA